MHLISNLFRSIYHLKNYFFQKLSFEYDIDFDEKLISEELLSKMIDEIEKSLPR